MSWNKYFRDLYLITLVCLPACVFGSNCGERTTLSFGNDNITWQTSSSLPIIRSQDDQSCLEEFLANSNSTGPWWIGVKAINRPENWAWVDYDSTDDLFLRHQGCFWEFYTDRDLPHDSTLTNVTVQNCINMCSDNDFKYAGLHDGDQCYCGPTFGKYGPTSGCSLPCDGNADETCGSSGKNSIYYTDGVWGTWMSGQPNNYDDNQYCGEMVKSGANYVLRDEDCAKKSTYACEIPDTGEPCPTNTGFGTGKYISNTSMCYYLSTSKMEWYLAQQSCNKIGGKLLTMTTTSTYDSIHLWLNETFSTEAVWLGLNRNRWQYTNEERLTYSKFASGQQPDSNTPTKKYIGVDLEDGDYVWKAYTATSRAVEIIETVVTTTMTTTDSTSTPITTAPPSGSTSSSATTAAPTTSSTSPETTQAPGDGSTSDGGVPATQASTSAGLSDALIAVIVVVCVLVVVIIIIIVMICVHGKIKKGEKVRHLDMTGDASKPNAGKLYYAAALKNSFTSWSMMGSASKTNLTNSAHQSNASLCSTPSSAVHNRTSGYKPRTFKRVVIDSESD